MGKLLRTVGWVSIVLGVIVGGLRATVLEWWRVPVDDPQHGASLAPSLYPGDLVLLWKGSLKAGDLVRCADPEAPGRHVVGRIMGEAGDNVELSGVDVIVNERRTVQEHSCSPAKVTVQDPSTGADVELHCGIEVLQSRKHMRATGMNSARSTVSRKATVAEGQVYLVSDNRAYPFDSRDYGGIPKASCKSFVFFRIKGLKGFGDAETRLTFVN
ncbi:MAG: signal peptidase I [Polyangiaceae bacterium]|jgi:signal peptidase I|nr:signal peptidase I [Polyangiaceae bacterium]